MDKIKHYCFPQSTLTSAFITSSVLAGHHEKGEMMPETVVELAVAAEGTSTLVAAVKAAGLVDVLSGKGPFTVLAPTDDAFAKTPRRCSGGSVS